MMLRCKRCNAEFSRRPTETRKGLCPACRQRMADWADATKLDRPGQKTARKWRNGTHGW